MDTRITELVPYVDNLILYLTDTERELKIFSGTLYVNIIYSPLNVLCRILGTHFD